MKRLPLLLLWTIFSSTFLFSAQLRSQTLLILGDSLSAGYQMPIEQAWPTLLERELQTKQNITIINGSVSGDTTANGLANLATLLALHHPDKVLIALGANDGLRGFPVKIVEENLRNLLLQIQQANATPLLMQIRTPPNYGKRYSESFAAIYPRLAKEFNLTLIDFFLEEVITHPTWMLADGLHPNEAAQPWIAHFMAQQLTPLL